MIEHDRFGPEKILEVYDATTGMHGFVVIDNTALGPGKGGIRMTPTVTCEEVSRLARAMTWKNALAGLPFGGAKGCIIADPKKISPQQKDAIVTAFAKAILCIAPKYYIAAPDINTAEHEMGLLAAVGGKDITTGKPAALGGIPHELGSTGYGVVEAAKVACTHLGIEIRGATVAIEGFGNVGEFAAKFIAEAGATVIAVSDSKGLAVFNSGFDIETLNSVKKERGSVTFYPGATVHDGHEIISQKVDILITAAIPDLIKINEVGEVNARIIVEGSNIPMSAETEELLTKKGVLIIPDFVANAGGVISSYAEWKGFGADSIWKLITEKIVPNTKIVLDHARSEKISTRAAGLEIAQKRILEAMNKK